MPPLIPFLLAILASGGGNLLLKAGMTKIGGITLSKANLAEELVKVFTNPFIIIGLTGYVVGFVLWLRILSATEVSRAYPVLVSSSIVLVLIGSTVFFKESFSILKFIGVGIIIFGIYLVFRN